MATLFDRLKAEATALFSITTHIADFLQSRRSDRIFLVETNAFFEYVQASVRSVQRFICGAIEPESKSAANVQADLSDLAALKVVFAMLHRLVRQACDADTLSIPYPIVAYINSLMGELRPATKARDAQILALATDELNFIHRRLDALRGACEEIFPKAVDGVANSSGLSFAIDEHNTVDQVL